MNYVTFSSLLLLFSLSLPSLSVFLERWINFKGLSLQCHQCTGLRIVAATYCRRRLQKVTKSVTTIQTAITVKNCWQHFLFLSSK
jgi:hypothetical protein